MPNNNIAISIKNLSKRYLLYKGSLQMLLDALGLLPASKVQEISTKMAVNNINLEIKKGERIGIIGRNGAGKSTLLKIITGLLQPTSGEININGKIQSLLTSGLGFHDELTGLENIKNSLSYNGLNNEDTKRALVDIIDFAELGEYINQPLKTYSLGMQSRLAFATSTAIKPEILLIDEVLGAGDAYFSTKSALRIKNLTHNSNTTLLLVSHSSSQILQFCDKCIWINDGEVKMYDDSLVVVKEYDKYINNIEKEKISSKNSISSKAIEDKKVSRWNSNLKGALISSFKILNAEKKEDSLFRTSDKIIFQLNFEINNLPNKTIAPLVYIYSKSGIPVSIITRDISLEENKHNYRVEIEVDNLVLGNGEYTITVCLYKSIDIYDISNCEYYDLIDRSYSFKVLNKIKNDPTLVKLSSSWTTTCR